MRTVTRLVEDLQAFLSEYDLAASELGWRAVRNSRLVDKLLDGGDCVTRTMDKLYEFMDEYRSSNKEQSNEPTNEDS